MDPNAPSYPNQPPTNYQPPYPYQQPPYPYPPPPSNKGAIVISRSAAITIGIIIVLIVGVATAVVGLRPGGFLNSNSLTGTWYGSLTVTGGSGGPPTFEVYGDLQQSGSTLTGTGEICAKNGTATQTFGNISLSGSADGSLYTVTLSLPSSFGSSTATYTFTGTYSVAGGTASGQGTGQNSSTSYTLSFKSGSLSDFQAACSRLAASRS